jgi:membrane fusion protein (multidrug efflux system)
MVSKRGSMRLLRYSGWLATFATAWLACGCSETKAKATPSPPTVLVAPVVRRDIPLFVEAVGTVDGYVDAEIRARVKGFLQAQKYKDGASVKEGQLLFTIEPAEYQAAVGSAKAGLARAQAAQEHNRAQLERRRALIASGVISQQELDDAAASAHDADGQVEAARAQLQQALLDLSYTQIRSPVSGVAGLALVRLGNLVGQGDPTLLTTVSQLDPMRVNFPIAEADYVKAPDRFKKLGERDLAWARAQFEKLDHGGTAEGDPGIELVLSDTSTYAHKGVLVAANRQIDPTTGTLQVQALFPNAEGVLRPGQYGHVRMRRTDAGQGAVVVPEKALVQVQGTYSVAVVGKDDHVQVRHIEVGPTSGTLRVVSSGLTVGERVVVEGLQKANDGALVAPQPAPEPSATPDVAQRP